jgi:hypothetical protein
MHAQAQARMKEIVLAVLPNLTISDTGYLEIADLTAELEPLAKYIAKNFDEWIDVDFLHAYVSVIDAITAQGLTPGPLGQVSTEAQREAIAQSVTDYWAGVPYTYEFAFQLPALDPFANPVEIAQGVTFKNVLIEQPAPLGIPFLGGGLLGDAMANEAAPAPPPQQRACLAVSSKGLMQLGFTGGVTDNAAIRRAKIALQLGMMAGVFDTGPTEGRNFAPVSEAAVSTLQGPLPMSNKIRIPASFGSVLSRVRRAEGSPPLVETLRPVGAVLTYEDRTGRRPSRNPREIAEAHFARHCARIATAAEWLFDAEGEWTPTALVQTAIAFEALYGGSKQDPVVETLSNRVAYTLGTSPQAREELIDSFITFYGTRSKVVHSGASRLTREQQGHLARAIAILHQAFRHELRLVGEGVEILQPVNADPQAPQQAEPA